MNQQLVGQCRALLATAPLTDEDRKAFTALLPQASDAEVQSLIVDLRELTEATTDLAREVDAVSESLLPDIENMTPEDVRLFSDDQWKNPEVHVLVRSYVMRLGYQRLSLNAGTLFRVLNDVLLKHPQWEASETETFSALKEYMYLAQWVRCVDLTRAELRDLFARSLLVILRTDLDPLRFFDDRLFFFSHDRLSLVGDLESVVTAFRSNEELIGRDSIDRAERGSVPPTIRYWLVDYEAVFTSEKPRGVVEEGSYITRSKNVQKLSPTERALLERVLKTFDALLFPERHQDVIPEAPRRERTAVVPAASFRGIRTESAVIPVTTNIAQDQKVEEVKKQLRSKHGDVLALFFDLVVSPHGTVAPPHALIAGFTILAEDNMLERAITAPKIREAFEAYLRTQDAPDLLQGFKLTPTMPRFMSLFFQWVLQDRGGLSENNAAHIGIRIVNILKKRGNAKYSRIAYFDETTNTFQWS